MAISKAQPLLRKPVFMQAVRESARNSVHLSNGVGVVDVDVLYHMAKRKGSQTLFHKNVSVQDYFNSQNPVLSYMPCPV
jgi:hypothetical protein